MRVSRMREHYRFVSVLTLIAFIASMAPRPARAGGDEPSRASAEKARVVVETTPSETTAESSTEASVTESTPTEPKGAGQRSESSARASESVAPAPAMSTLSLPTGGDKTGIATQAISVPQGAGKIQGMGESFSIQLSTGLATFSVPLALSHARGGVQPALNLSYSASGGHGVAGVGWSVGVPFIARQTDRATPRYLDPSVLSAGWNPNQDRFVFNGGQELVPICLVSGPDCVGALNEKMPIWANGWQYFRPRVEGAFLRFFWSPDHRTWRVQSKSGESMELGASLDGVDAGSLETNPTDSTQIFQWDLARQYDAEGLANPTNGVPLPVNVVAYRYRIVDGLSYLTDIYDTPPRDGAAVAPVTAYAHHTRLTYEARPDATFSFKRGWYVGQTQRLTGVDVTSKTATGGVGAPRKLVRRYHLSYDLGSHVSLLTSIVVEGRCGSGDEASEPVAEGPQGQSLDVLPVTTNCPTLPPMTLGYQHVAVSPDARDPMLAKYEGFDEHVVNMSNSPPHSVDELLTELVDVDADSLPDVVVAAPALYNGKHGVYFNSAGGQSDHFGDAEGMDVRGVPNEDTGVIKFDNANLSESDLDGDGVINLIHMPKAKTYSVYSPQHDSNGWFWQGRSIATASAQSPKIDFRTNSAATKVMDVNGDGLVDVVFSSGTEYQTFFALGRFPEGDGQFGSATWASASTSNISNDPVTSCLPWSAAPVLLSDPDVRIGDMNGDGFPDIVRVRPGDIRYWPGRGNGFWGTGDPSSCPGGEFGQGRDIAMATSPQFGAVGTGDTLLIDDINGDGLDDLVKVQFNAVEIYVNVDGIGWTGRHTVANTPIRAAAANRVRVMDLNGSGTRDLVWGEGRNYQYIDLAGGTRPWVLNHVENGLGKTTDIEYTSSTALMLAAQTTAGLWEPNAVTPWTSKTPMPIHVVTKVTDSDNLHVVGHAEGRYVTTYSYRDPVYDGRQREFRGFARVRATPIGDANSPTSSTDSTFLLGQCLDEGQTGSLPSPCTVAGIWRDNPREALKGLPTTSETFDENRIYQSTSHHTYRLRHLYQGLDGREVRHAFESASDTWNYDTAAFDGAAVPVTCGEVELEIEPPPLTAPIAVYESEFALPAEQSAKLTLRATSGRAHMHTGSQVDVAGNAVIGHDDGCVDGCLSIDSRIEHVSVPGRAPSDASDASGWMWRMLEEWVQGQGEPVRRHHQLTTYDAAGNPIQSRQELLGTLPLQRDTSVGVPPAPMFASTDQTIVTSVVQRDPFGTVVFEQGPNHRCRSIEYDDDYAHLPFRETLFVGAVDQTGSQCGSVALASTADYDRGFDLVIAVHDLHAELTTIAYDGFARIVKLWKPDPTNLGQHSLWPSVEIEYLLPVSTQTTPYSRLYTRIQDGVDASTESYRESWSYTDGFGRTLVTLDQADPGAGDQAPWVANGLTNYDARGRAERAYLSWWYVGDPSAFPLNTAPTTAFSRQRYDAFGRPLQTFGLDGAITLQSSYHSLSVDKWDAADLAPGPHQGTFASALQDGHGRSVSVTERVHANGHLEAHETRTTFNSTGEPTVIARIKVGASDPPVVRWLRYDTLGRMVLNVEPNTTAGFIATPIEYPADPPSTLRAWRYAYDDAGDLVGTSDARGCGANDFYDAGGRALAEDYWPCSKKQAPYSPPDLTTGAGAEVFNRYDFADPYSESIAGFPVRSELLRGRLVSVSDRASKTVTQFDGRGRVAGIARQMARPQVGSIEAISTYAPRWYVQTVTFDGSDRPLSETTGVVDRATDSTPAVLDVQTIVTTSYSKRGKIALVSSNKGVLVSKVIHDADGLALQIEYGDIAKTTTGFSYDSRRRLASVQTYRGQPSLWSMAPGGITPAPDSGGSPSTLQLLLEDLDFAYDEVDNPTEIRDWRIADEWPAGAKPVTRKMQYDDLYRATRIDYQYGSGNDTWVSPFDAEIKNSNADPKRVMPSPHVSFDKRILSQSFQYDWLGNTSSTSDDARGFYDRSLGTITNGGGSVGPYQLKSATNASNTPGSPSREGKLVAAYDDSGYMTGLIVRRDGPCLPAGSVCSQRFVYDWDEVGRLSRARRWDLIDPGSLEDPPPEGPVADLRYGYDALDGRAQKAAVDASGNALFTVYPFPSLELRRTAWNDVVGDFDRTSSTQSSYLFAHGTRLARVALAEEDLPSATSGAEHVFLELMDHLGSTGIVIERDTSELVERSTYQGYGAAESDYRPERWKSFREDYRFTGKEEDAEVGLQSFGKRYYVPRLGRWLSADPMNIHALKADPNNYAYVEGAVLKLADPNGLMPPDPRAVGALFTTAWHSLPPVRIADNIRTGMSWREGLAPFALEAWAWHQAKSSFVYDNLLDHYFDNTRTTYVLSQKEVLALNANVDVTQQWINPGNGEQELRAGGNAEFYGKVNELKGQAAPGRPAVGDVTFGGGSIAQTNGTLGRFLISYAGKLTVQADGQWSFQGAMKFHDRWDFDPSETSGRNPQAEAQTNFAHKALPGSPFEIESGDIAVKQTSRDSEAQWEGSVPTVQGDPPESLTITQELYDK